MVLSRDLAKQFAKATKDKEAPKKETVLYGKAKVEGEGDSLKYFVQLDGSDIYTPVDTTVEVETNERVTVMMKGHNAVITGNISSPSARKITVDSIEVDLKEDVEEAKKNAESAKYTALNYIHASGEGFILSQKTNDVLGQHLKLVPEGIYIQNGNSILARYYGENIDLGVTSDSAVISFNGGRFIMNHEENNATLSNGDGPIRVYGIGGASLGRAGYGQTTIGGSGITLSSSGPVNINLRQYTSNNSGRLYLCAGDSISMDWYGAGYVSNSGEIIYFSIPLSRMILGPITVSVASVDGLKIRHVNGGYSHGSGATSFVKPSSYSARLQASNMVLVEATMSSTANAVNNSPCGISASIKITIG